MPTPPPPSPSLTPTPPPPASTPAVPIAPTVTTPAPGPGSLSISLGFPRVAEKPPVLSLVLYNRTPEPFHYREHRSAPCQLARFVALTVRDAAGKVLAGAQCAPESGVERTVPAGGKVELALPLGDLYPGIANGTYDLAASWAAAEAGGAPGPQRELSQPGRPLTIRPIVRAFVVKRGETVQLASGATLLFAGHSHKDVDEQSAPSPLIVEGTLTPAGGKPDKFYVHVQPEAKSPGSRVFAVGDHYFVLGEYEYGASMHLAYFGQLR